MNFLEKLTSYNIFNYLLPGVLFAAVADHTTKYQFIHPDIVIGLFLYYFLGLVISRIGSLMVGPILHRIGLIRFAPYRDFVSACEHDPKIEMFSEQNNMYRTLCALSVCLAGVKLFDLATDRIAVGPELTFWLLLLGLTVLFAVAYRKQSAFIRQRIERTQSSDRNTVTGDK